jgi:catechol 2,3-dioxygenase-like lactoylglutathione lyase family enzyme
MPQGELCMVQKIDHVVIAVNDLNEGIAQYEKTFGLKPSRTGERWPSRISNPRWRRCGHAVSG